jgi:DNA-binding beta-propeller fold protein YncE
VSRTRRGRIVGALVVALAAIAAAGYLLLGGGEPEPRAFRVPAHPIGLAVAGHEVWVAAPQSGALTVLDTRSGRRVGDPVRTGGTPSRVALGDKGAWVADTARGAVIPVRRSNDHAYDPLRVGADVSDVALSAGAVWVLDSAEGVVRTLEPGGAPIRDLPIGPDAVDLAADERWVVAVSAGNAELTWIDARARRIAGHVALGGVPVAVDVTGDVAWVADAARDAVIRVDLRSGKAAGSIRVGAKPVAIAADGDDVYVLCGGDRMVWNVDGDGDVLWKRPAGRDPAAIALGADDVWVADAGADTVLRLER